MRVHAIGGFRGNMVFLASYSVIFSSFVGGAASYTGHDFRVEYPAAVTRLEDRFSRVRGSGHLTIKRTTPGKEGVIRSAQITFFCDGAYMKFVAVNEPTRDHGGPHSQINVATPGVCFSVQRAQAGSPPILRSWKAGEADELDPTSRMKSHYIDVAFVANLYPIKEILNSPKYHVIGTGPDPNKPDHVRVDYVQDIVSAKATVKWRCFVVLDPNQGWIMKEFEMDSGKAKRKITVEYGEPQKGIPALKRIVETSFGSQSVLEFGQFLFEGTPLSEFTTSAVGLPDLKVTGTSAARSRLPYWLIGAGIVAAICAALVSARYRFRPPKS